MDGIPLNIDTFPEGEKVGENHWRVAGVSCTQAEYDFYREHGFLMQPWPIDPRGVVRIQAGEEE